MAKAPKRTLAKATPSVGRRARKLSRAAKSSTAVVAVETLGEQAERLGLLDPLDAEPASVFAAASPQESGT